MISYVSAQSVLNYELECADSCGEGFGAVTSLYTDSRVEKLETSGALWLCLKKKKKNYIKHPQNEVPVLTGTKYVVAVGIGPRTISSLPQRQAY